MTACKLLLSLALLLGIPFASQPTFAQAPTGSITNYISAATNAIWDASLLWPALVDGSWGGNDFSVFAAKGTNDAFKISLTNAYTLNGRGQLIGRGTNDLTISRMALTALMTNQVPQTVTNQVPQVVTNFDNVVMTNWVDEVATNFVDEVVTNIDNSLMTNVVEQLITNLVEQVVTNEVTQVVTNQVEQLTTNLVEQVVTNLDNQVVTNLVQDVTTNLVDQVVTNQVGELVTNLVDQLATVYVPQVVTNWHWAAVENLDPVLSTYVTSGSVTGTKGNAIVKYVNHSSGMVQLDGVSRRVTTTKAYYIFITANGASLRGTSGNLIAISGKREYGTGGPFNTFNPFSYYLGGGGWTLVLNFDPPSAGAPNRLTGTATATLSSQWAYSFQFTGRYIPTKNQSQLLLQGVKGDATTADARGATLSVTLGSNGQILKMLGRIAGQGILQR